MNKLCQCWCCHQHSAFFVKYRKFDNLFFERILRVVYERNLSGAIELRLWMDFFAGNFERIGDNLELIENSYLQQERLQNLHFDFELKGLKNILAKDPSFIVRYIGSLENSDLRSYSRESRNLGFVWELEGAVGYITQLFDQEAV